MSAQSIKTVVAEFLGLGDTVDIQVRPVSGGDIHRSFAVNLGSGEQRGNSLFVKSNQRDYAEVLRSEYDALTAMAHLPDCNYPKPLHLHVDKTACYLLMEYRHIEPLSQSGYASLGKMLASQHRVTSNNFGWPSANFIGLTPQLNTQSGNWADFFRTCRLQPQLELALSRGLSAALAHRIELVCARLPQLIGSHPVEPVLLHGDLWSGNCGWDAQQQLPLLFDPAPYYGDHEADLAMTELFGGFSQSFYQCYAESREIDAGYARRKTVYNLYHALNHFNLFGASYQAMVDSHVRQIDLAQ